MIELIYLDFSCICTARFKHTFNASNSVAFESNCNCGRVIKVLASTTEWGLAVTLKLVKKPAFVKKNLRNNFLKVNEMAVQHSNCSKDDNILIFKNSKSLIQNNEIDCNCGQKIHYWLGMNCEKYSIRSEYDVLAGVIENLELYTQEMEKL